MANYASLKAAIQDVIKTNGNNEITGALLQQSLLSMINSLGVNYQYVGIANLSTNPGTPDQNVFYLATVPGTYANFGGLVVGDEEIAFLKWNGSWTKDATTISSLSFLSLDFQCFRKYLDDGSNLPVAGTLPTQGENRGRAGIYRSFISLKLRGFDKTIPHNLVYLSRNYSGGYRMRISAYQNDAWTIVFDATLTNVETVPNGINKWEATVGGKTVTAYIDYGLLYASSGFWNLFAAPYQYTHYIIREECFDAFVSESDFLQLQSDFNTFVLNALLKSDLTVSVVSKNLANPTGILLNTLVSSAGTVSPNNSWDAYQFPVTEGKTYIIGGFKLGRAGYYAFYNGTTKISNGQYLDPNGSANPFTLTAPTGATLLYFDIRSSVSPENPYGYLQINEGTTFEEYDEYSEKITAINGIGVVGISGSDPRVPQLISDVEQLQEDVADLQGGVNGVVVDLPVSDGSNIQQGYAYINSSTGIVTVKL